MATWVPRRIRDQRDLLTDPAEGQALVKAGAGYQGADVVTAVELPGDIAQVLADNPDVIAAAAALAQSDASLVHKTDPGIPASETLAGYDEAAISAGPDKQVARGLTSTGRVHAPLTVAQQIEHATGIDANGLPIGVSHTETIESIAGYSRMSVQGRKMGEDALDDQGKRPRWLLRRWWRRMSSIDPWGVGLDWPPVWLLPVCGQSNAGKVVGPVNAIARTDYDFPRILRWQPNDPEDPARTDGELVVENGIEWIGSGFAREWIKANPHKTIVTVPAGHGASGFFTTSLNPAPTGYRHVADSVGTWDRNFTANTGQVDPKTYPTTLLDQRVAAASAAVEERFGIVPPKLAMLWCQGEADNATDPAVYQSMLDDLFAWARDLWDTPLLPIILASITPFKIYDPGNAGFGAIDKVHMDTPRRVLCSSYCRGPEFAEENTYNDQQEFRSHFIAWAHEQRGAVLASRGLPRAIQNQPQPHGIDAPLHPPINVTARRYGDQVTVRWEHPYCQIDGFVADYSTSPGADGYAADNGATWTSITLPHQMTIEATFTQASPVCVRVASYNDEFSSYFAKVTV